MQLIFFSNANHSAPGVELDNGLAHIEDAGGVCFDPAQFGGGFQVLFEVYEPRRYRFIGQLCPSCSEAFWDFFSLSFEKFL